MLPPGWPGVRAGGGWGAWGSAGGPPAGRERFLQSLLSAKGARRPGERSSAGASGGLLPAGSGKADAVWSSARQTATTSHNFILESRPAAAPAPAGERTESAVRPGRPSTAAPAPPGLSGHLRLAPRPRGDPSDSLGVRTQPPFSSDTLSRGLIVAQGR